MSQEGTDALLSLIAALTENTAALRENTAAHRGGGSGGGGGNRAVGGVGGGSVVKFGRDKGKRLSEVADLTWYREAIAKGIDDPEKMRWRQDNIALLAEIDAAMGREPAAAGGGQGQSDGGSGVRDFGGGPQDDDIPFIHCRGIR